MSRRQRRSQVAEINVVPYIDVMLVLLVIFMVTAPVLTQGVTVDLPEATSAPLETNQENMFLIVSLTKDAQYYLERGQKKETAATIDQVQKYVAVMLKENSKIEVLVRGDENVKYGAVMELMVSLQAAGAKSVGMINEPPSAK